MRTAILFALLCLVSCARAPRPSEPAAPADITRTQVGHEADTSRTELVKLPVKSDKLIDKLTPPTPPTNPAGREYRAYKRQLAAWEKVQVAQAKAEAQARRAPLFVGKGAVVAPQAKDVVNAYKPAAPVVLAKDSAAVNVAVGKKAPVIAGDGNTVPTTNNNGFPWWMVAVGIALLLAVVFRKRLPFIGPFFS